MKTLASSFQSPEAYRASDGRYSLLPFKMDRLDDQRFVISNIAGEFAVISQETLTSLVHHKLSPTSRQYEILKSRHFIIDATSTVAMDLLSTRLRTTYDDLADLTSLFIFVTTLRCEHSCRYCQVSRQSDDKSSFDMSTDAAGHAVDFLFKTPAKEVKIEFQGGEPLLNFELLKTVVDLVETRAPKEGKKASFVIATNLAPLTDDHIAFFRKHDFAVSTSLDGPIALHNKNRPRRGSDSYQKAVDGIRRCREALGHHSVSALMTTTEESLDQPEEIVDEYQRLGFGSVFLRSISPYGFAAKSGHATRYDVTRWLRFYERALRRILEINKAGTPMREEFAAIILRKMLTPWPSGYVDLRSPAGIGIGAMVFNYDGGIYPSDEARMLAEMGDQSFRLGSLGETTWESAMTSDALLTPLLESMTETAPMCSECAVQPYCGADPVGHYTTQGDFGARDLAAR